MTIEEKIEKAEERIKELKVLIFHWKNARNNINYRNKKLSLVEQSRSLKEDLTAA